MIVLGYNGFSKSAEIFGRLFRATGIDRHLLYGHDSSVALVIDGQLVAAAEEERFNRQKKTSQFPIHAMRWCLDQAGISLKDVDTFAFSWKFTDEVMNAMLREITDDPKCTTTAKFGRLSRLGEAYAALYSEDAIVDDFRTHTGFDLDPANLIMVPHHLAHLMTGYHLAGSSDAAFVVSDGRAEWLSAIAGEVRDGQINTFDDLSITSRHSLAMLYSVITRYLGFVPNNDEYKVMGLAGYGEPPAIADNPFLTHVISVASDGTYTIPYAANEIPAYYALFDQIFGATKPEEREEFDFRVRVGCAAQQMIEVATAAQLTEVDRRTDLPKLLLEGGLALNCVNNSKLLEASSFTEMDVSFGASDVGVGIGAALYASQLIDAPPRVTTTAYLGPSYTNAQIQEALQSFSTHVTWRELDQDAVIRETATLLTQKCVIGWFQGRMEFGPRALGNRSILANPSYPDIKDIINERIKHREQFRPFAPVILEELAPKVFDMGKKTSSPFMTFVFDVRSDYRDLIQGACHVDGTARIQTVNERQNPVLAELLRAFTAASDVPCLINTSFNVAGEPIVCSPADAISCYLNTEMDYLVLGNFLVTRA